MQPAPSILALTADQPPEAAVSLGVASIPLPCEDNERRGLARLAQSDPPGRPAKAVGVAWPIWTPTHQDRVALTHGDTFSPVLTISEAAGMLGVSTKRMQNIIAEEKGRLGRLPDFVCDAAGTTRRRIIRDEFLDWIKSRKVRRGRPSKTA